MKMRFPFTGTMAAIVLGSLLGAQTARAQLPTLCQPAAGDFEKTVQLVDIDGNGLVTPGDELTYTVKLCNPAGAPACNTSLLDQLDNLMGGPGLPPKTDIEIIPAAACPGNTTLCERGNRAGPTGPALTVRCGQDPTDCTSDPKALAFQPENTERLAANECFYWTIRARIASTINQNECLCNQASAPRDFMGGEFFSNDPAWATLDPGLGCEDTVTCPNAGTCNTCVKVLAESNLTSSIKCIDGAAAPCATTIPKTAGSPIVYNFTIENTGTVDAQGVLLSDILDFQSSSAPPTPCLDLSSDPVIGPLTCSWGPCGTPDYAVTYDAGTRTVNGNFLSIPKKPGAGRSTITFSITTRVNPAATGNCTNNWSLSGGIPPISTQVNAPVFNVGSGPVVQVTKTPSAASVPPSSPFSWTVTIQNTGTAPALGVMFTDNIQTQLCETLVNCGGVSCTPTPGCSAPTLSCAPPGPVTAGPFDIAAGGSVTFTINVMSSSTPGDCINPVTVSGSNFSTQQAQGRVTIGGNVVLDVAKVGSPNPVNPGAPFQWVVTITNPTSQVARGVNFTDDFSTSTCNALVNCDAVTCSPSACSPPIGLNCNPATPPVRATAPFDIPAGGSVRIPINVTAGGIGNCSNTVDVTGTNVAATSASGSVTIAAGPSLVVSKTPSKSPVVPGEMFDWTISIQNIGSGAATGVTLTDDLDLNGCETLVSCGTPTCAPACTPATIAACNAPSDFSSSVFDLQPNETMTFTVTAQAGSTTGSCVNTAVVRGGNFSEARRDGTVTISSGNCALQSGDVTAINPVTPTRTGAWVYTKTCGTGDNVLPDVRMATATDDTDIEPLTATPVLRLYTLDCGCGQTVKLVKKGTPPQVHLYLQ